MKIVLSVFIILLLSGCSSKFLLTNIQQQLLKLYITYSNNLIENILKNYLNPRLILLPYRARYRLVLQIFKKL